MVIRIERFNSIKVQLEHSLFVPANALEVSFNSIKVQLEPDIENVQTKVL